MVDFKQFISHRFRGFSPVENTIDGLKAALDFGVKQIEFDIRVARCGTPMTYHDESAIGADGIAHHLCDVMARDFKKVGGSFTYMPTTEALFAAIASHSNTDCALLIDIKDAGFESMIYALAQAYGIIERIVWVSWLPEVLYAMDDIESGQKLCLSHWCRRPGRRTRALHHVFSAINGHIRRPARTLVMGERSGWFVDGPIRGDIRKIITHVCVPAGQVWPDLVKQYQADRIEVSAFSYTEQNILEKEYKRLNLNSYFIDNKTLFEIYKP